jgi:hypothetical protein
MSNLLLAIEYGDNNPDNNAARRPETTTDAVSAFSGFEVQGRHR